MKINKKIILAIIIIAIIILISVTTTIIIVKNNSKKPEEMLKQYISCITNQNYEEMYNKISNKSKESTSKEDFIKRNKNIYEGIEANNIEIEIGEINKNNNTVTVNYNLKMDTIAGKIIYENKANFVKEEKTYKLEWSSNDIFPQLSNDDKVKVKTTSAQRGKILDRNDVVLAGMGTASSIGLVPGKMSENKEQDLQKVSELLDISVENINKMLNASYVKEDTFVPIKTVAKTEQELKNNLLQIKGIKIIDTKTRTYEYGEKTAHLLGYIQNINADELKELEKDGYNQNSVIGKAGIEKQYENKLRGIDGSEIIITDSKGKQKQTLAKRKVKNGEDIKLTIDINIQTKLYDQFCKDKSAEVAINYKTGEILALVSTPTFNSNDFAMGMTNNKWNELKQNQDNPLYNRFQATYAPGSSFKPVIGAIGITTGKLNPEENFGRSGTSWQKDSSWGTYKITTLKEYGDQVNLKNALINSDNIYFAKTAIKIGSQTLSEQLLKIGFDEKLPLNNEISKSTFGNNNKIETEVQLADTGYGQGKVLVNPIHMASVYSGFLNNGDMLLPYMEYKENVKKEVWKTQAFTKEASNTIKEDLIQVVEDEQGTAHTVKIEGKTIGGKTGTAEIKDSKEDNNGTEIGWFNAFCEDKSLLIISMVEDVKNKGGSHYLLPKVKAIFEL